MITDYEINRIDKDKYQLILYKASEESEGLVLTKWELYQFYSQLRTMFKDEVE